jgi:hypothetical protein
MALRVAKVAVSSGPDGVIARALDILAQAGKTVFPTRAAFVAWVDAGNTVPDGMVVTAAGLNYLAQTGATAIADLPGFDSPASARTTISTAPLYIGQFAVVSGVPYISVGTASTADWIELALA